jgi:hypothetical protein
MVIRKYAAVFLVLLSLITVCTGCTDSNYNDNDVAITYLENYDNYNFDKYEIPELNAAIEAFSNDIIIYCAYEQFDEEYNDDRNVDDNYTFYMYNIKTEEKTKLLNVRYNDYLRIGSEPIEIDGHIYFFFPHNNKEKTYTKDQFSYSLYDIDLKNKVMSEVFENKGHFIQYNLAELDGNLLIHSGFAEKDKHKETLYIKMFDPKTKNLTTLLEKNFQVTDLDKKIYTGESIVGMNVDGDNVSAFIQNFDENKWYVNTFEYKDNELKPLKEINVTFLGTGDNELNAGFDYFNYCNEYLSYENVNLMSFLGKVTDDGLVEEIFSYKINEEDIISLPSSDTFSTSAYVKNAGSISNLNNTDIFSSGDSADDFDSNFKIEDITFITDTLRDNEKQLLISESAANTICIFNNTTGELQKKIFRYENSPNYYICGIEQSGSKILVSMRYNDPYSNEVFPDKLYYLDINDL